MSESTLLTDRNREIYLDWSWETAVELRRSQAVYERLSRIYYVTDRTILRILEDINKSQFAPNPEALTSNELYSWKIFKVLRETYMGGHELYHVIVGNWKLADFRTLSEAKSYINKKAKLIQFRLELLKLYE